ncbi:hypothetical protein RCL_jg13059.t1 [Rhizophagus clarus]|uniref:Uncharacterized protein n=1 Tax=Rhizophagus clarus TaxID=94130 RepID=A0A8H3QDH2_9GLOM|nr:hypothetical protein RCL_jg13059.t1 [Rhizophagus clarus]
MIDLNLLREEHSRNSIILLLSLSRNDRSELKWLYFTSYFDVPPLSSYVISYRVNNPENSKGKSPSCYGYRIYGIYGKPLDAFDKTRFLPNSKVLEELAEHPSGIVVYSGHEAIEIHNWIIFIS